MQVITLIFNHVLKVWSRN